MSQRPLALTVAGSDPGGGAGIGADLRTFEALGADGACVVTAVTAQSASGVHAVAAMEPALVAAQLDALVADRQVAAAKTGMLWNAAIVEAVAERIRAHGLAGRVVVDPVLAASSGGRLLDDAGLRALVTSLLPLCALVTPNLAEAEALTGVAIDDVAGMSQAARAIVRLGAPAALVKGGHLAGAAVDVLFDGRREQRFETPRLRGADPHGTGCVLSAAIAAGLAHGRDLRDAIARAKAYVTETIAAEAAVASV